MRAALASALVLVFVGCVGTTPAAPGIITSAPTIELQGCENFGANFPVPFDAARALLPDGWLPALQSSSPQKTAQHYVIGLRCAHALIDGVDVGEALIGYEELGVVPPPAYRTPGITDYVAPLLFAAHPAELGDALEALHLGLSGAGTVTRTTFGPADMAFHVALGDANFDLRGTYVPNTGQLGAGGFRLFGIQNREIVSTVDGYTTGATSQSAAMALTTTSSGLISQAPPAARGFVVSGFDYTLTPT